MHWDKSVDCIVDALRYELKSATGKTIKLKRELVEDAVGKLEHLKSRQPEPGRLPCGAWEDDT